MVNGHAYSILDARDILDGKERLVKLRNPWGTFEWSGNYSDDSSKWTDDLKKELELKPDEKDGIFWMPYEDFLELFYMTDICYCQEGYVRSSFTTSIHSKTFKFTVPPGNPGRYSFCLSHKDPRHWPQGVKKMHPSKVVIYEMPEDESDWRNQIKYIDGEFNDG
jgi:calpain-15